MPRSVVQGFNVSCCGGCGVYTRSGVHEMSPSGAPNEGAGRVQKGVEPENYKRGARAKRGPNGPFEESKFDGRCRWICEDVGRGAAGRRKKRSRVSFWKSDNPHERTRTDLLEVLSDLCANFPCAGESVRVWHRREGDEGLVALSAQLS